MQVLTSARNPTLKEMRKAIARGTLTDSGFAVAESFHLLEEALRSGCEIGGVFAAESVVSAVLPHVKGLREVPVSVLPDELFQSIAATEASQGVIALVRPPVWSLEHLLRAQTLLLVLDGVQDPGNAGTIIRSAEAFGATGVAMLRGCASPFNPKSLRASAGSAFRVPLSCGLEDRLLLAALEQRSVEVYVLMPGGGADLARVDLRTRCALVIGSEGRGVSERLRIQGAEVRIPTVGVESLNAAMAATAALYEARRQRMGPKRELV